MQPLTNDIQGQLAQAELVTRVWSATSLTVLSDRWSRVSNRSMSASIKHLVANQAHPLRRGRQPGDRKGDHICPANQVTV